MLRATFCLAADINPRYSEPGIGQAGPSCSPTEKRRLAVPRHRRARHRRTPRMFDRKGSPAGTIGIGARITTLGGSATVGGDVTGVTSRGTFDIPIGPLTPSADPSA